jgi:cell fate (sporulation/competence/biofilm development) regulator YlbF (YheA/YmcA/DUF963 family)
LWQGRIARIVFSHRPSRAEPPARGLGQRRTDPCISLAGAILTGKRDAALSAVAPRPCSPVWSAIPTGRPRPDLRGKLPASFSRMPRANHERNAMSADAAIALAEKLGKALADSEPATKVHHAKEAIRQDSELTETLRDFESAAHKVRQLSAENKPIEPADKQKLEQLHSVLIASDAFKKLTAAQVEYAELMRKINETINGQLAEIEKPI